VNRYELSGFMDGISKEAVTKGLVRSAIGSAFKRIGDTPMMAERVLMEIGLWKGSKSAVLNPAHRNRVRGFIKRLRSTFPKGRMPGWKLDPRYIGQGGSLRKVLEIS